MEFSMEGYPPCPSRGLIALKHIFYDTGNSLFKFGWVRIFLLKSTKPHHFVHYAKKKLLFFHVSDHLRKFQGIFSPHFIFVNKLIIWMDGGFPWTIPWFIFHFFNFLINNLYLICPVHASANCECWILATLFTILHKSSTTKNTSNS